MLDDVPPTPLRSTIVRILYLFISSLQSAFVEKLTLAHLVKARVAQPTKVINFLKSSRWREVFKAHPMASEYTIPRSIQFLSEYTIPLSIVLMNVAAVVQAPWNIRPKRISASSPTSTTTTTTTTTTQQQKKNVLLLL